MRARATALVTAVIALSAVVAAFHSHDAAAQAAALRASGDAQVGNSRLGEAILSGALGPGDSLSGTVTISNIGAASGPFTLGLSNLTDAPGPGGGYLSQALDLDVEDVTDALAPVAVYHGPLGSLGATALGTFDPGAVHVYRFVVSWASGPADQTMSGSSVSVQFDWSASSDGTGPTPPPPPTPTPPPSGTSGGAGGTVAAPRLTLSMPAKQPAAKRGAVRATAVCSQNCTVAASGSLKVPGVRKTFRLTRVRVNLVAGRKGALKIKLPRSARGPVRKALRAHKRPVATITAAATGSAGKSVRLKRKVRLTG
jgi:hypothetical protein